MSQSPETPHHSMRWTLIRDVIFFQLKLAADALRDLLLSPLSVIAAIIDLAASEHRHQSLFYRVLQLGKRTEGWINLFGAAEVEAENSKKQQSIDQWMSQVERVMKDQYEKGGVTASAKHAVDRLLDHVRTAAQSGNGGRNGDKNTAPPQSQSDADNGNA